MKPYAPLINILGELKPHLMLQHTGTFFIASSDNTSARFGIIKGEIVFCCCQRFHGKEAVQKLNEIVAGRSFFSHSLFPFHDKSKVSHQATLNTLNISLASDKNTEKQIEDEPKVTTYIYRGQRIEKVEPKKADNKVKRKTSQRYYRGQPLND